MLNGNSGYGASVGNTVTGSDKYSPAPVAVMVCKPVTVWRTHPGR